MKHLKYLVYFFLIFMLIGSINSCYYDEYSIEIKPVDPTDTISFSNDILPVFIQSCAISICHGRGAVAPDLTNSNAYNSLIDGNFVNTNDPEASELYQWMIGNRDADMPPSGPNFELSAEVLAWITQGALNN